MDFNDTLAKLKEGTVSPQDQQTQQMKQIALAKLKKAGQVKDGDDIELDPNDPSKTKWKIIPKQVVAQGNRATITR